MTTRTAPVRRRIRYLKPLLLAVAEVVGLGEAGVAGLTPHAVRALPEFYQPYAVLHTCVWRHPLLAVLAAVVVLALIRAWLLGRADRRVPLRLTQRDTASLGAGQGFMIQEGRIIPVVYPQLHLPPCTKPLKPIPDDPNIGHRLYEQVMKELEREHLERSARAGSGELPLAMPSTSPHPKRGS